MDSFYPKKERNDESNVNENSRDKEKRNISNNNNLASNMLMES